MFFTEINVFVIAQRVKYQKKLPLGTSTEFQVPIPVPYQFKCGRYPTLHLSGSCSWLELRCGQRLPCSQGFPWALQSKIADFQITVGSHLIKDAVPSVSSWFWLFPSEDRHDRCLQCLGIQHAKAALVDVSCACCGRMTMASPLFCKKNGTLCRHPSRYLWLVQGTAGWRSGRSEGYNKTLTAGYVPTDLLFLMQRRSR